MATVTFIELNLKQIYPLTKSMELGPS